MRVNQLFELKNTHSLSFKSSPYSSKLKFSDFVDDVFIPSNKSSIELVEQQKEGIAQKKEEKKNFYNLNELLPEYDFNSRMFIKRIFINSVTSQLYNSPEKVKRLVDALREGEAREVQLDTFFKLVKNKKFTDGDDITNIIMPLRNKDRAVFRLSETERLSNNPNINGKDLGIIIPYLREEFYENQSALINNIYLPCKKQYSKKANDSFIEIFSSADNKKVVDTQLNLFEKMIKQYKINPSDVIELLTHISNEQDTQIKSSAILSLIDLGLNASDLNIVLPKITNETTLNVQLKAAKYFLEEKKFKSSDVVKFMSNISSPEVFNIHKNLLDRIQNKRDFSPSSLLEIISNVQKKDVAELKYEAVSLLADLGRLDGYNIAKIVTNIDSAYEAEVKVALAKSLARTTNLSGFQIALLASGANSDKLAKIKYDMIKKLLKTSLSYPAASYVVSRVLNKESADLQIDFIKELGKNSKTKQEFFGIMLPSIKNSDLFKAKLKAYNELLSIDKLKSEELALIINKISADSKDAYIIETVKKLASLKDFSSKDITKIISTMSFNKHTYKEIVDYFISLPKELRNKIEDYSIIQDFYKFKDKTYLTHDDKNELNSMLIKHDRALFDEKLDFIHDLFPFLPSNTNEYCQILSALLNTSISTPSTVKSYDISNFFSSMDNFIDPKGNFAKLDLTNSKNLPKLSYSKDKFIHDVLKLFNGLSDKEKSQLTDVYSFSVSYVSNKPTIQGFPMISEKNVQKNKILLTKDIKLRELVEKFIVGNSVTIPNNPTLELDVNNILYAIPELFTTVGKIQNQYHDYTLFNHILCTLQSVIKNPDFQNLSKSDQKALFIATLLHDISKSEFEFDKHHSQNSAQDAYKIIDRFNLTKDERGKIYAIIRNHEWLKYYNKPGISDLQKKERAKRIAHSLRKGNSFDLVSILCEADLKSVKKSNTFFEEFKDVLSEGKNIVSKYVNLLQSTAIPLPQTKLPKASELKVDGKIVRELIVGGIRNKVIYINKNTDISKALGLKSNTDDISVLVHGLDSETKSLVFQSMSDVEQEPLISSSYVNLEKGNWKVFRQQGFILDVDNDDIHAAYYKDFGSGDKKNVEDLLTDYLYEGFYKPHRDYFSNKIKEKLNISDNDYIKLYNDIKNKTYSEIRKDFPFVAIALKQLIMDMQGGEYTYGRNYNEILVSKPKIQGVFAYDKSITQVPKYLRKYAQDTDTPIIIFES